MSKSTIGPHAPSKAQSQYSIEPSSGGIFFETKGAIVSLILGLTACGGGDGSTPGSTPPVTPPLTPAVAPPVTLPGTTPIESVPVSSSSYIELGPIAGGTVSFQTLSGKVLSTGGTKDDGSLDYNPRDIVSKMGSDQWLLVNVSGGRDTDVDDDGVTDAVPTPLLGSFRMLVPRSTLELGGKIVVNPRSGMISELLLAKKTAITLESLDIGAKQSGAEDQNNDGVVNYKDTYSVRMRDVKGVSKIVPATSGYITSIHSGNAANKTAALSKVAKTENHIMTHIIPANDTNDHAPSLELTTSTPGATILYTLDSSNPVPGGATTRSALSRVVVPFQNAKIYYREYTTINGQEVLGKVAGFDLLSDWTELTQSNVPYNSSGKMNTSTESSTYKNIPYYITTTTNSASSGYTYPKTITCKVGVQRDAGCHYGPYMIWSPEHEATVRSMIDRAIKVYIDTPTIPIAPVPIFPLNYPVPSSFVSYRGGYGYQLLTTMNISGTSDYPASVRVSYTTPLSNNNTTETTNVSSAAKLATIQAERINEAKASIDLIMNADQFEPNYIEFLTNTTNYGGGSYYTTFTYSGNAGQDYPGSLEVHVTYRNGSKEKLTKQVDNASQKILSANSLENQAKTQIDTTNNIVIPVVLVDIVRNSISYNGSTYTIKDTWTQGANNTKVFPVTIDLIINRKNGQTYTAKKTANSASELTNLNASIEQDAKAYIDADNIPTPIFPPNYPVPSSFVSYRGGYGYQLLTTMNISGTSDYPASVRVSYTTPLSNNNTTQTTNVSSAAQLAYVQDVKINEAKTNIDLIMNADQFEPNYIQFLTNTTNYGGGSYYTTFTYSGNVGQDYPGTLEVHLTYRKGSKEKLTQQVDNASQKILSANSLEDQAKIKIDNYNPTFPVDLIGSNGPFQYGNKGSEYTFKVKYNSNGTSMNYPALVWIEYRSRSTGQLMNTLNTYGRTIANSSVEKDQYYSQLEQWVMGQMVALGDNTSEKTRFATNWKLHNLLPLSSAHAATPSTNIIVQKNDIQLPNFSPYNSNTTYGKFFAAGTVWDHFVRNEVGKGGVASNKPELVDLKEVIVNIQNSVEKINSTYAQCSHAGTTLPDGKNTGCILDPAQQAQIRGYEQSIFEQIGNYLSFGGGLSVGAGAAIYEEIMGVGSDVRQLADGTTIIAFEKNLGTLKQQIGKYFQSGIVNADLLISDLKNGSEQATAEGIQFMTELAPIIKNVPGILVGYISSHPNESGYYTGKIGGSIALQIVSPIKKFNLLTKGLALERSARLAITIARYIDDSKKIGHTPKQVFDNIKKLEKMRWSNLDQPDMSKIQSQALKNRIKENYRNGATYGNGSNADAARIQRETGMFVGGGDHIDKSDREWRTLKKQIESGEFTGSDKNIASAMMNDLQDALGYKPQ